MRHGELPAAEPLSLDHEWALIQDLDLDDREMWDGLAGEMKTGVCPCHAHCVCDEP